MVLRVEQGRRRGTAALICPGPLGNSEPRVRLSRNVAAGDGRFLAGGDWGSSPTPIRPLQVYEEDAEVVVVLGAEVVNVIEAATRVRVEIDVLGIDEEVIWPELDILPGMVVRGPGLRFQGSLPLVADEVEVAPHDTLELQRSADGRVVAKAFSLVSRTGSGRVVATSADPGLVLRPTAIEVSPKTPVSVVAEWVDPPPAAETTVSVSFDYAGTSCRRRVTIAAPAVAVVPDPLDPTVVRPAPKPGGSTRYRLTPETDAIVRWSLFRSRPNVVFHLQSLGPPLRVAVDASDATVMLEGANLRSVAPAGAEDFRYRPSPGGREAVELAFDIDGHRETRRIVFARTPWWIWAIVASLLLLALAGAGYFYYTHLRPPPAEPATDPAPRSEPAVPPSAEPVAPPPTPPQPAPSPAPAPVVVQPVGPSLGALLRERDRCRQAARLLDLSDQELARPDGNRDLAQDALVAAADCGVPEAVFRRGRAFDPSRPAEDGVARIDLPDRALEHYWQAARAGHADAARALESLCNWVRGRPGDQSTAVETAIESYCGRRAGGG